jgi:hypothetical protein
MIPDRQVQNGGGAHQNCAEKSERGDLTHN